MDWDLEKASEIYMDAITIDLKSVKFPDASQVMLKSRWVPPHLVKCA